AGLAPDSRPRVAVDRAQLEPALAAFQDIQARPCLALVDAAADKPRVTPFLDDHIRQLVAVDVAILDRPQPLAQDTQPAPLAVVDFAAAQQRVALVADLDAVRTVAHHGALLQRAAGLLPEQHSHRLAVPNQAAAQQGVARLDVHVRALVAVDQAIRPDALAPAQHQDTLLAAVVDLAVAQLRAAPLADRQSRLRATCDHAPWH